MNQSPLATLDVEAAIARIAAGTLSREIAEEFGVTSWAVRKKLAKHPEYESAVREQAASLVEQAMQKVMTCGEDEVAIARARVDACYKWAAARDPARWGPKQAPTLQVNVLVAPEQLGSMSEILASAAANLRQLQGETQQVIEDAEYSEVDNRIDSPSPAEDGADGGSET